MKTTFLGWVLMLLVLGACQRNYVIKEESPIPEGVKLVKIEKLEVITDPIPISASGVLASTSELTLSFKIGGVIDRINVKEGQSVRKGQLLASLNLAEINSEVIKATNNVDKLERDLQRVTNLFEDTVATLEQVQNVQTALDVAKADLRIANFNQRYARIEAPASGKILRKHADEGELTSPGVPILQLGATNGADAYIIRIGVADKDVVRVQEGDPGTIRFDAYPGRDFPASVSKVAEAADPRSGAFEIELTLQPTEAILKNGFIGKVSIAPQKVEPYHKIPLTAMIEGERDEVSIFLTTSNSESATKVKVRPRYIGDDYFVIGAAEVQNMMYVVTEGAAYLTDGDELSIVN